MVVLKIRNKEMLLRKIKVKEIAKEQRLKYGKIYPCLIAKAVKCSFVFAKK